MKNVSTAFLALIALLSGGCSLAYFWDYIRAGTTDWDFVTIGFVISAGCIAWIFLLKQAEREETASNTRINARIAEDARSKQRKAQPPIAPPSPSEDERPE